MNKNNPKSTLLLFKNNKYKIIIEISKNRKKKLIIFLYLIFLNIKNSKINFINIYIYISNQILQDQIFVT